MCKPEFVNIVNNRIKPAKTKALKLDYFTYFDYFEIRLSDSAHYNLVRYQDVVCNMRSLFRKPVNNF